MSCALKRKKLCSLLVLLDFEDVEEEIDYLVHHYCIRKSVSEVFFCREEEGVFRILIEKHLLDDEVKFKAYFRFTREQFYFLVNLIQDDLSTKPCNRVKRPISPAEKLALTLRYVLGMVYIQNDSLFHLYSTHTKYLHGIMNHSV